VATPLKYVNVRVAWTVPEKRFIDIAYTVPGKETQTLHPVHAVRTDRYEFRRGLKPGERVSVTADQTQHGFLQCAMLDDHDHLQNIEDGEVYQHRNDPGSVSCAYTVPLGPVG
jgi:hypothetical protein